MCFLIWVGVSESIYKGISPEGVDALIQWEECKCCGSELAQSTYRKPASEVSPQWALQCSAYLFILVGGQMYVRRCWISATGKIKDRRRKNEAVKVARQLGPEANIPLLHILL